MDLTWIGGTGLATLVATAISSGVAVTLHRRLHPGPELRLLEPIVEPKYHPYGEFCRSFTLRNIGPDPAYDVRISGAPAFITFVKFGSGADLVPSLTGSAFERVEVGVASESDLRRATVSLSWKTSPRGKRVAKTLRVTDLL